MLFALAGAARADVSVTLPERTVKAGERLTIRGRIEPGAELDVVLASRLEFVPGETAGRMEKDRLQQAGETFGFDPDTRVPYLYYVVSSHPERYGRVREKRFGGAFFFKGLYKTTMFGLHAWNGLSEDARAVLGPIRTEAEWNLLRYAHEVPFGVETVGKEKTCVGKELVFSRCVVSDEETHKHYWNEDTHVTVDKRTGAFEVVFPTFRHTRPDTAFDIYVNGVKSGAFTVRPNGFWLPLGWRYVHIWLIVIGAIIAGTFYSMIGASGGLLMAAFQVMFVGTAGPLGVNAANVLKPSNLALTCAANISGLWRYWLKERRLVLPVAAVFALGVFLGAFVIGPPLSARYLNMSTYKPWLALVIFVIFFRALYDLTPAAMAKRQSVKAVIDKFAAQVRRVKQEGGSIRIGHVETVRFSVLRHEFKFWGETFHVNLLALALCGVLIGVVSAAFGIGGGFMLVPAVTILGGLPMHVAVPIALFACLAGSLGGIVRYILMGYPPDIWIAGAIVVGGLTGGVIGSKLHGLFSEKTLKIILAVLLLLIAFRFLGIVIWI
ncbi:MAG: sulfite exporter TauE/SafE family protein [Lentisphaerae bacterium]|nr:sulfite exporter TauE/SafE family protein [Lentisphaerota bacterium]